MVFRAEITTLALASRRELWDGGCDDVDVGFQCRRDAVILTGYVITSICVLVEVVFRFEEGFDFAGCGVECYPT